MNGKELARLISYAVRAHEKFPKEPSMTVRRWDGKTPYGIHPVWCATTLLHETNLPAKLRIVGAQTLLFHDLLEDTVTILPKGISLRVKELVEGMTFTSSNEEMKKIWERPKEIRLFKLYDKVSNILDGTWMAPKKKRKYLTYIRRLADDVEQNYGLLNVVRIARAL